MSRLWSVIRRSYVSLLTVLSSISFAIIFFMAIWMCVDVIGRSIFNHPIPGTPELVKSLLPAVVFLSLAYTLRQGRHVNVEIITQRLHGWAREITNFVAMLFGFIVFIIVTFYSWEPAWSGWLEREYEGVQLKVPIYPVRFIVFLGAAIFSIQFLINMVESVRAMRRLGKEGGNE